MNSKSVRKGKPAQGQRGSLFPEAHAGQSRGRSFPRAQSRLSEDPLLARRSAREQAQGQIPERAELPCPGPESLKGATPQPLHCTYVIDRPRPKPELRDGVHSRWGPAQEAQGNAQQLGPGGQAAEEPGREPSRRATGGGHLDAEAAPALPEPGHAPGPHLAWLRPQRGRGHGGKSRSSPSEEGV